MNTDKQTTASNSEKPTATFKQILLHGLGFGQLPQNYAKNIQSQTESGGIDSIQGFILGAILGAVLGYPISFFFQPGLLRAVTSLGEYFAKFKDVIEDPKFSSTVYITVVFSALVFAALGVVYANNSKNKKA